MTTEEINSIVEKCRLAIERESRLPSHERLERLKKTGLVDERGQLISEPQGTHSNGNGSSSR